DIVQRPLNIGHKGITVHLFGVDGLMSTLMLDETILKPLTLDENLKDMQTEKEVMEYLLEGGAFHAFTDEVADYQLLLRYILSGMAALVFDQEQKALIFDVRDFDKRSITEPSDEGVMKGAKDSFIEVMRTNTVLIRRRLKSEFLVMEQLNVGKLSKTDITIAYLSNVADMDTVNRVRDTLQNIDIDNVSTPAFIEEYLVDNKKSIFPQIMYTQRPDRVSANLTDGRVAVVVDGIPFVYILPCQMVMLMQSPEDYANHFFIGSSLRIIRYIAMILTIFLPAFYIAATTYQNQMLPAEIALSIQKAKQNVPFSSASEVLGLLVSFEILIEAGLRLPKTVGTAMSILGGLVVGQSAVEAKLVSPTVVVIVALAGIAGFILPNQDLSSGIRLTRFIMAVLAAIGGFFGMTAGLILLITHLCSLDNYGVAYMSPFVDVEKSNHKDTLFRFPIKYFTKRSKKIAPENHTKQK
ncbi:MAG TPA: spore germination protein, partial [Lachnospiraceae bacterium]|nr:spore germination protein [Lachnospiraceae bacterium]